MRGREYGICSYERGHTDVSGHALQEKEPECTQLGRLPRRVLVRQHMEPDKTYYLRFKSCLELSSQLYMDFFELCPKSIYDNPETPEDI